MVNIKKTDKNKIIELKFNSKETTFEETDGIIMLGWFLSGFFFSQSQ